MPSTSKHLVAVLGKWLRSCTIMIRWPGRREVAQWTPLDGLHKGKQKVWCKPPKEEWSLSKCCTLVPVYLENIVVDCWCPTLFPIEWDGRGGQDSSESEWVCGGHGIDGSSLSLPHCRSDSNPYITNLGESLLLQQNLPSTLLFCYRSLMEKTFVSRSV